jgi:Alr-MurF fusion protein
MKDFPYTLADIARITKGKIIARGNPDAVISEYLIDSRKLINPGECLFIALKTKRNDGHKYIGELMGKGVRNFLISSPPPAPSPKREGVILVPDTLEALQTLGMHHRAQFTIPVIGITGSNGKTIVKEWLFQLMSRDMDIIRSPKSFNSQIGVPLSVLKAEPRHELAIFEAGISEPGEMERLEAVIRPTIGIFTNIGQAHGENFETTDDKIREKLKLFVRSEVLIWCKDHRHIERILRESGNFADIRSFTWGRKPDSDILMRNLEKTAGKTTIDSSFRGKSFSISIPFTDDASIENALHCQALMLFMGYNPATISERMASLIPIAMRLELKEGINRCSVINDSYNSDINSLAIAIDFLHQQKQHKKKTVILSDILQSGKQQDELYTEIGSILSRTGINRIIGIGSDISAQSDKFSGEKSFFTTTDEFLDQYALSSFHDETILLKGARIFEFEKISKALEQKVHETVLEINLDAMVHNLNHYRSKLPPGTKTMAMVKAFSYGSGSFEIANLLQFHHVDYLAVAYADEGVELRRAGITLPVMVMNPEEQSFNLLLKYDLEPEIYNVRVLRMLEQAINVGHHPGKKVNIHIKLDTGMHRLGFMKSGIDELCAILAGHPHFTVRSVFSHLAASEDPAEDEFTRSQIREYHEMADRIHAAAGYPFLQHVLNSAGIIRFPEAVMDMVRLGIGLYGVGFDDMEQSRLRNVSTLKTVISQVKEVKADDTVGYNRKGILHRDSVIAVVPIGYADGLNRRLSNGMGKLFIHGRPAPVVGNISMDICMVDITDIVTSGIRVKEGDDVIVFGDSYLLSSLARDMGTIPYEVLTSISRRVKRVYFYE